MCGILGIYPPIQKEVFKATLDTITHRGPDDYGIFENKDIMLGHRRLSIIDLSSNGHQPMGYGTLDDHTQQYQIVFNGEIYNYLELKNELISKGYVFHTQSDTEVILASYDCWGEKCLNRFNGMWAFAIWDSKKHQLFLSRDRFGKKPLFYAFVKSSKRQTHFVFASEMKAIYPFLKNITPHQNFDQMVSLGGLFNYEHTKECLVSGIYRFPHSHHAFLDTHSNSLKLQRYYCPLDHIQSSPQTYTQAVERFRELFLDATRIRMRADVSLGTALSGGLDSSATICAMSHINQSQNTQKDWQHAFVACFPNTPLDESKYAQSVVDYLGISATYLDINPVKYWDKIEEYFYLFEDLYLTSPIPMIATYQSVKQNGISVTLDGHGADELFSGYGHLIEALWDCGGNIKQILSVLDTLNQTRLVQSTPTQLCKEYLVYFIKKAIKKLIGKNLRSQDSAHPNFKMLDNFSQHLYIIFYETILPTLLRNYDRYSMINSVEIRMPFMDHRLVEFVFSLPYSYKFGNGYTKKLIRDALKDLMPQDVVWRKSKIGFNSPILQWMQNDKKNNGLKEWFLDIAHSQDFLDCSLIANPKNLQEQIINICNSSDKNIPFAIGEKIWCSLNPYLWQKSFKYANIGAGF